MMGNRYANLYLVCGLLIGLIASAASMYMWYVATIGDASIKGMPLLMLFFILLPACLAFVSSFINPPLILLAFVWSAPLSLYMLAYANIGRGFGITCLLYLLSAILKFHGLKDQPISS